MASSASGQDGTNSVFCLATRSGEKGELVSRKHFVKKTGKHKSQNTKRHKGVECHIISIISVDNRFKSTNTVRFVLANENQVPVNSPLYSKKASNPFETNKMNNYTSVFFLNPHVGFRRV